MADEHRHADRRFVHQSLVEQAVLAEEETIVAGVNDERVLTQACPDEIVQEPTDILIDAEQDAVVVLDQDLVVEPRTFLGGHVGPNAAFAEVRHVGDAHVRHAKGFGPGRLVIEKARRKRNLDVLESLREAGRGLG